MAIHRRVICLAAFSLMLWGTSATAGEYTYVIEQLTDNTINDSVPQVSGKYTAWQSQSGSASASSEIWLDDGLTTIQLTDNTYLDQEPQLSGNRVTWSAQPDGTAANQREIYYFDGSTTTRLTNDLVRDLTPKISGSTVIWEHGDANGKEIYRSNGAPLTSNAVIDTASDIYGSRIIWVNGSTPNQKIMLYDGTTTIVAATSTLAINKPQVSDSLVVWQGYKNTNADSSGAEIYRYDGTNPTQPTNLSNNEFTDFDPQVSGNHVVWWGGVFGDRQIYFNDGTTTTPISTGTLNLYPQIDGNLVVWQGNDGDDEIFVWDGTSAVQITHNNYADSRPQISGNHIVWTSTAGGADTEIMSAIRVLFGDANFDGTVDGGDYTSWANNFMLTDVGFAEGDFNQDGVVDGGDYTLWANNFLATDGLAPLLTTAAVPEPSSLVLALTASGLALLARSKVLRGRPGPGQG